MKKTLMPSIIIVLGLILLLAVPTSAVETEGTCGENMTWTFDEVTGTLTITGYGEMDAGEHSIWMDHRKYVTRIVIGEGVTSIGDGAFDGFNKLLSVSLPTSLRTIEAGAFRSCAKLKEINIQNVTSIAKYAFCDSGITTLTIPSGVKTISYGAFSGCRSLTQVIFHDALTEIDSYAFNDCVSLTSVIIPDSVKRIGSSAFRSCYNLSHVELGSGLTTLGGNAFSSCPFLIKISIPDGVTEIKNYTFSGCTSLQEVVIGAGVSSIETTAFKECSNLKGFSLSSANASFSIHNGVLYNKSKTELILMPEGFSGEYTVLPGTTKVGKYACYGAGITSLTIPGSVATIEDYSFDDCKKLGSVKLSNGLKTIGVYAFAGAAFSEITIPATVREIESLAFYRCSNLKKIVFTGEAPELGEAAFSGLDIDIYYPGDKAGWRGATGLYGGTPHWISTSCKSHQPVTDSAKVPTCTESGLTEGTHCSICEAVIVEQEVIPAKGHSYDEWAQIDDANHKSVCVICLQETTQAHVWNDGSWIKQSNCIESGEKVYTCVDCAATKTVTIDKTTTHNYDQWSHIDDISHQHVCVDCGKGEKEEHVWDDGVVTEKATCIVEGLKIYTCTGCGITKSETIAILNTHTFDHACDTDCNFCGIMRTIEHNYNSSYSSNIHGHWIQCKVCGAHKDFTEHIPGPDPTEEMPQTCIVCDFMLLPALNHIHYYAQGWTTDEQGHWHVCDGCEEYGSYEVHDFSNDCDSVCDICDYTRETSHNYGSEWECDGLSHWHSCMACSAPEDIENHVPGAEATTTNAQLCKICGYELFPAIGSTIEPVENISQQIFNKDTLIKIVLLSSAVIGIAFAVVVVWKKRK